MTNLKEVDLFGLIWIPLDDIEFDAFIGLEIMAGVMKSNGEILKSVWDKKIGRPIFRSTMPLKRFVEISTSLRSEDRAER